MPGVRVGRLVGHRREATAAAQKTTGYNWRLQNSISERKTQPTKPTHCAEARRTKYSGQSVHGRKEQFVTPSSQLILTSIVLFLLQILFFLPSRKQKKWLSVQCLSHKLAQSHFSCCPTFFTVCPLKAWLMHLCGHFALWRSEKPKRVSFEHLCAVTDRF